MENNLSNLHLTFIGCGVMAESIIAGLLRKKLVKAEQITASHPRESRRKELAEKYGIRIFEKNTEAVESVRSTENSGVFLCVKPQRIKAILEELKGFVTPDQMVLSIIAGAKIETISTALGNEKIVRTMPNTPAQIGAGMTAWTCTGKYFRSGKSADQIFAVGTRQRIARRK